MPAGSPVPTGTTPHRSMAQLASRGAADDRVLNRHSNVARNALVNQKRLNNRVREAIRCKSVLMWQTKKMKYKLQQGKCELYQDNIISLKKGLLQSSWKM